MPLGNLTSQFFANVYLNELDQFVKHVLKVKNYIRYVDDFVILHQDKHVLEEYKEKINVFLQKTLLIDLHPDKCKIISFKRGITFLGFRIFYYHKLLKKTNTRTMRNKFERLKHLYTEGLINYDIIYDYFQGWFAYANHANTYKLRKKLGNKIQEYFPDEISTIEYNRITKHVI